jgi:hypothetical protein
LSPRDALIGTWASPRPETVISGTWQQAVALNGVGRAQARRYYQTMEREPAMPPAIVRRPVEAYEAIGPALIPGYSADAARTSERRLRAVTEVNRLIEASDDTTMTLITGELRKAA